MGENRFFATAGRGLGGNDRFRLWRATFYRALGVELEKGKQYEIHGTIDDGLEFTIHHVKSTCPYVYLTLPKKDANQVALGRVHVISIDSVKERTDYNVFENVDGPAVKISRLLMSLRGFGPDQYPKGQLLRLELGCKNLTKQGQPVRCFLSYVVGSAVSIRVQKFGVHGGDLLKLEYVKIFEPDDFVRDFERLKNEDSNLTLLAQDEGLVLQVDAERFELKSPQVTFFGRWVTLSAIIAPTMKEVRFRFDLANKLTDIRFFKDKPVHMMRAGPGNLEIQYRSGRAGDRVFSVYRDKLDKSRLLDDLCLLSYPEMGVGRFLGQISPKAAHYVRSRLASSAHTGRWSREKGDISEEVQAHLLQSSGKWVEVARHPFSTGERVYDSSRFGPDSLMKSKNTSELCYFEFKWWEHFPVRALHDAREQAAANLHRYPSYLDQKVVKTFAAILDWDTRDMRMEMLTDQIKAE